MKLAVEIFGMVLRMSHFGPRTLDKKTMPLLLMVLKSGVHQLSLVVFPVIYRVYPTSQVVVWDFSHQQYHQCIVMARNLRCTR